ncbi:MAG TPA: hypothetical protein VJ770_22070 [Stellaceae bacterium]|nr:hypothetical protein [Stellaceae bacterium]
MDLHAPDPLIVSPYLNRPLDQSYRGFLDEQIARLEAEPRCLADQLAMLREERERLSGLICCKFKKKDESSPCQR